MSERDDDSAAVSWASSTVPVVPASLLVLSLGTLLAAPTVGDSGRAAGTVGFVLAEALVLYVGYGGLTRLLGPTVRRLLVGS